MFIIDFLRNNSLKKHSSKIRTSLTPLREIKTAVTVIDVEDTSFNACKNAVTVFYREFNIKGDIFYFDFRKLSDEERLITSITNTVLKKDLNFFGRPSKEKMSLLLDARPDLFISLINKDDYPIQYMASCCEARYKVGRKQLPGDVFDLVFSDQTDPESNALPEEEVFKSMRELMMKIK